MSTQILVPMDDSEIAERALEYAVELHLEAELTVMHVIGAPSMTERTGVTFEEGVQRELEERAEAIFRRAKDVAAEAGFEGDLRTKTGIGAPARSIVDHAEDVDAIIMGSQGRDGAARVLLGSVAETVARRATVPVTIVR